MGWTLEEKIFLPPTSHDQRQSHMRGPRPSQDLCLFGTCGSCCLSYLSLSFIIIFLFYLLIIWNIQLINLQKSPLTQIKPPSNFEFSLIKLKTKNKFLNNKNQGLYTKIHQPKLITININKLPYSPQQLLFGPKNITNPCYFQN